MEVLLLIVALIVGIFVIAGSGNSRGERSSPPTTSKERRTLPAQYGTSSPSRFDEKSAKHLRGERILTGAVYVTDGDTIKIKNVQVRLFGIDAPELNHPYGKQAKWALHKLCKGHQVRAVISEEDDYGRTVAQCFLPDGRDLSAEMVSMGFALDWPKFSGGKYTDLEPEGARKKHWKAAARQRGHMDIFHK